MFQSKEPFGIAAIVAYTACLTLTILLVSAPYFASYFINYYKKLHQIEEAILLLSDQDRSKVKTVDELSSLPPYSAVSALTDERDLEENGSLNEDPLDGTLDESSADDAQGIKEAAIETRHAHEHGAEVKALSGSTDQQNPRAAPKKKKSMLSSEDEFQLSLFDSPSPEVSVETESLVFDDGKSIPDGQSQEDTAIHAYLLLDASAKLFIRGDAPFSQEKGIELKALDVGKFATEGFSIVEPISVCFLINDDEKRISETFEIEPHTLNECYPEI